MGLLFVYFAQHSFIHCIAILQMYADFLTSKNELFLKKLSIQYVIFFIKFLKNLSRIDYCGISILTMGSFVPWLYYAFYCEVIAKIIYLVLIAILGTSCIVVSLWDKFSQPEFRAVRAGKRFDLFLFHKSF